MKGLFHSFHIVSSCCLDILIHILIQICKPCMRVADTTFRRQNTANQTDLLLGCQGFMKEYNILNVFAYGIYEDDTSNCRYICPNWWMLVTPYMICAFFGMQNLLLICPNHIGEFTAASQCVDGAIFSGLCPTYIWIYQSKKALFFGECTHQNFNMMKLAMM